jgi:hypothetical protein
MTQIVDSTVGAQTLIDDYDAICKVLQLCTDGESKGDSGKLKEAFHTDSRMFGALGGTRYDVPIQELFAMADEGPADTGSYRARVVSVNQTGDAAAATVAEEGYWGSVSFVDYFLLARIDGAWKIVCKLFAHTGGEPPVA